MSNSRQNKISVGETPRLCQMALVEMLEELFKKKKYKGPAGLRAVGFYEQEIPLPADTDYDADTADAPAPFIIVRSEAGKIPDDDSPQVMDFSIIMCTFDDSDQRTGWQDVVNMREQIIQKICSTPYFGGAFTIQKPISWAMQQDDTHPYYYGVITLKITAPALSQDEVLKELL